jgi:transketolase
VGIAEQSLVGVAAGLASCGKNVFAVSPASFLSARSFEQIKNDVAYSDNPVTLVGISAGVSYGALGSTHHSLHDLAALRAVNNMTIIVPADNFEAAEAIRAGARATHPFYVRFGKRPMPHVHGADATFEPGRAITVRDGADIGFIAAGEALHPALDAAEALAAEGIEATVASMHTIKPLDTRTVVAMAKRCGAIVTVEEAMVHGGLGEACAAAILEAGVAARLSIAGIPDEYTVSGSQKEIFAHYGLTGEALKERAMRLLRQKTAA